MTDQEIKQKWSEAHSRMWANGEFDDKFSRTLEFAYAFQMGYKAATKECYSLEDLKKAQQAILCNQKDASMNENYIIEYINSLKEKK